MTTSDVAHPHSPPGGRLPLRLKLADQPGRGKLDGGWWPQSRDLAVELADLVDHFPPEAGRVVRVLHSPPDWDDRPRRVAVALGFIKVGCFPRDDTHIIQLRTSDGTLLQILVIPPGMSRAQGEEALLAAATPGNTHSASSLLEAVSDWPDVDPRDRWTDEGGAWWDPHPLPPSLRVGG